MSRETFMVGRGDDVSVRCFSCGRWRSLPDMTVRLERVVVDMCGECSEEQEAELHKNEVRYNDPRQS